jgi:putative FmdB family regulatory protein
MPFYEYSPLREGCEKCEGRFSVLEDVHAKPLEECPNCSAPIERVFSLFSIGGNAPLPSSTKAIPTKSSAHNHNCAKVGCHGRANTLIEKKFGK